tara:strand:- start:22081 stop:22650 length:570 start_codon:yes stop_codon:yes gene_type:complete
MSLTKSQLRRQALAARNQQQSKDAVSNAIIDRVLSLPPYVRAAVALWYVDVRDEVRTRGALREAITSDKKIVVPYCVNKSLRLFHLQSMDELQAAAFGILEPRQELRSLTDKNITADALDFIIVPGVAFSPERQRLGHGKGYYDRLLSTVPESTTKVGVAFDCQIIKSIPSDPHDIAMDVVLTQSRMFT